MMDVGYLVFQSESFKIYKNMDDRGFYSIRWFDGWKQMPMICITGTFMLSWAARTLDDACLIGYLGTKCIVTRNDQQCIDRDKLINLIEIVKIVVDANEQ